MNMILHGYATAEIAQGNTLASPRFLEGDGTVKTFDFMVANPPFSDKRWSTGFDPEKDDHQRFKGFGIPPAKQGDYAYLLHIVRSLKASGPAGTGKGAAARDGIFLIDTLRERSAKRCELFGLRVHASSA